jgi:RNA polymerase sigma factor (sigma-70 family)
VNLNEIYKRAIEADERAEEHLFSYLSVRFRVIANLKIGDEYDAEDLVQEALMTIAREYKTIEFEKSFSAWAHKVLDNKILSYIGGKKRQTARVVKSLPPDAAIGISSNTDQELKLRIKSCLDKVKAANKRYARILVLRYQGYSAEEICDKFKITSKNLYMILSRARVLFKRCIETGEINS